MGKALFIGNGINRVIKSKGEKSWEDLLRDVQKKHGASHIDLTNKLKPFTLSFEELIMNTNGTYEGNVKKFKETIAGVFSNVEPNEFHRRIMNSKKVKHVITTNYDYAFEKVIVQHFNNNQGRLPNATTETKHSVKRRCVMDNGGGQKSVWHVHGEINHNQRFRKRQYKSQSIQIGYNHYGEYLKEIQDYVEGRKYKDGKKIREKILKDSEPISWIDILFSDYVIFMGLELDFSEIDIWWLLNYRQKLYKKDPDLSKNRIIYYQPVLNFEYYDFNLDVRSLLEKDFEEYQDKTFKKLFYENKCKAKKDVLESLGVIYREVLCNEYKEYYYEVLNKENI